MKVDVETWTIDEFIRLKDKIHEQPPYQRGEVWLPIKRKLLIDSIVRGIDIPKIYLRKNDKANAVYEYEIADGQQRISAILDYIDNKFKLELNSYNGLDLNVLGIHRIGGKLFSELDTTIQDTIKAYKLTIAIVKDAKGDEIRTLFGRLQMGSPLNPAEKRNAILCSIGNEVNNFARNHRFFSKSKISVTRFKREDYMAHVIAYIKLKSIDDLKAYTLTKLYSDTPSHILTDLDRKKIDSVLDNMYTLNSKLSWKIVNKFTFIDFFILFYFRLDNYKIDYDGIATFFISIEEVRNYYRRVGLEKVYEKEDIEKEAADILYNYMFSFQHEGAKISSINARQKAFEYYFNQFFVAETI